METYKDFKNINIYITYIKNHKWTFNFSINRVSATPDIDNSVYDNSHICKNVDQYDKYIDCFKDLIEEINKLYFCTLCKRFDESFCKICKLDEIIDDLSQNDLNEECPVCYKILSNRYITICNNDTHKLCATCYDKMDKYSNNSCPLCRGNNEENNL